MCVVLAFLFREFSNRYNSSNIAFYYVDFSLLNIDCYVGISIIEFEVHSL